MCIKGTAYIPLSKICAPFPLPTPEPGPSLYKNPVKNHIKNEKQGVQGKHWMKCVENSMNLYQPHRNPGFWWIWPRGTTSCVCGGTRAGGARGARPPWGGQRPSGWRTSDKGVQSERRAHPRLLHPELVCTKDALALGGGKKSSRGQKLVAVSRRKSQRARGGRSRRAGGHCAQRSGLRAPVAIGRRFRWCFSRLLQRQLLKFKLVYSFLLLVVPRWQV